MKKLTSLFIFTLFTLVLSLLTLTSCVNVNYVYDNPDSYHVGGATLTESIDGLDIDWMSGEVRILLHDLSTVVLAEESSGNIGEDHSLRYKISDGRLTVKFAKSAVFNTGLPNKTLTVYLPRAAVLNELKINTAAADATLLEVAARAVDFESASGDITMEECDVSASFDAETASGDIALTNCRIKNEVSVDTASGSVSLGLLTTLATAEISTASGNVSISASEIKRLEAETASGDICLSISVAPESIEFESASGNATLDLPSELNATLSFETASGKSDVSLPHTTKDGKIVFGDGEALYEIELVSGNLTVK